MSLTHVYERARSLAQFTKDNVLGIANRWVHLGLAAIVSLLGAAAGPVRPWRRPSRRRRHTRSPRLTTRATPLSTRCWASTSQARSPGLRPGAAGHPNKGYLLSPPYGQSSYVSENFPGSVQTQSPASTTAA